ncbi:MAG: hypothetical protein KIT84_19920 [Labilithrix sp.]|nr:hypothetical protein [Labilithrix sp.]MCW5813306.1 hypothetical protein [Labilithrix sp.]
MNAATFLRVAVASLLAVLVGCAAEEVGESGRDVKLLTGTRLSPSQVSSELRAAGFEESAIGKMLCTAKYESSYYDRALDRSGRNVKRGLFQIASKYVGELDGCPNSTEELYDPALNAQCARAIFEAEGIETWSSYTAHKSECDRMKPPPPPAATQPGTDVVTTPVSMPEPTEDDVNEAESAPAPTPAPSTPDPATPGSPSEPDPATPAPPPPPAAIVGGCFSNTLQDTMEPGACVESKFDKVWQQCKDGKWYRGGDDTNGRFGPCNGSFPLPE